MFGQPLTKLLLILVSILFLFSAFLSFGLGVTLKKKSDSYKHLSRFSKDISDLKALDEPSHLESAIVVFIACGIIAVILAIAGIFSVFKPLGACYCLYIVLVLVVFGMQVLSIVAAMKFKDTFTQYGKRFMNSSLALKYVGPFRTDDEVSRSWDRLQFELKCCGAEGPNIYMFTTKWDKTWENQAHVAVIPYTCCKFKPGTEFESLTKPDILMKQIVQPKCPITGEERHKEGCYTKVSDELKGMFTIIVAIGTVLCLIEIFALGIIIYVMIQYRKLLRQKESEEVGAYVNVTET